MKRLMCLLFVLAPTAALADASYNAETNVTHDCATDPVVAVNASEGTYTFTGTCTKIAINGSDNKVKIEAVGTISVNGSDNTVDIGATDKIALTGSDNKVTYKKGLKKPKAKPRISRLGSGNAIKKVK